MNLSQIHAQNFDWNANTCIITSVKICSMESVANTCTKFRLKCKYMHYYIIKYYLIDPVANTCSELWLKCKYMHYYISKYCLIELVANTCAKCWLKCKYKHSYIVLYCIVNTCILISINVIYWTCRKYLRKISNLNSVDTDATK